MSYFDETYKNSYAINLTNRCNTYCKYCYRAANTGKKEELYYNDVKRIVEYFNSEYPHEKKRYVILSGGEVFVNPDIFSIIELFLQNQYDVRLQTNGISISEMNNKELKLLSDKRISFKFSLDGATSEIHEINRAAGTFDLLMKTISVLKSVHQESIGITTVVTKDNIDDLTNIISLCTDLGIKGFTYNILRLDGYGDCLSAEKVISEDEVIRRILPFITKKEHLKLLNGCNILKYALLGTNYIETVPQFYIYNTGDVYCDNRLKFSAIGNVKSDKKLSFVFDETKLNVYTKNQISNDTYNLIIKRLKEVI